MSMTKCMVTIILVLLKDQTTDSTCIYPLRVYLIKNASRYTPHFPNKGPTIGHFNMYVNHKNLLVNQTSNRKTLLLL